MSHIYQQRSIQWYCVRELLMFSMETKRNLYCIVVTHEPKSNTFTPQKTDQRKRQHPRRNTGRLLYQIVRQLLRVYNVGNLVICSYNPRYVINPTVNFQWSIETNLHCIYLFIHCAILTPKNTQNFSAKLWKAGAKSRNLGSKKPTKSVHDPGRTDCQSKHGHSHWSALCRTLEGLALLLPLKIE